METENIDKKDKYYVKYIKYKSKYLNLKKQIELENSYNNKDLLYGSGASDIFSKFASSAMDFASKNPELAANIAGTAASTIPSSFNMNSILNSNVALNFLKMQMSRLPPNHPLKMLYSDLERNGLLTDHNMSMIIEFVKLGMSHMMDPEFYPILYKVTINTLKLASAAENPAMILSAGESIKELYDVLNMLKNNQKYHQDFIILTNFLKENKQKLLPIIGKYGGSYYKFFYDMFQQAVYVPSNKMNYPQQNIPQMNYPQPNIPQMNYPQPNNSQLNIPQMNYPQPNNLQQDIPLTNNLFI